MCTLKRKTLELRRILSHLLLANNPKVGNLMIPGLTPRPASARVAQIASPGTWIALMEDGHRTEKLRPPAPGNVFYLTIFVKIFFFLIARFSIS